MSRTGQEKQSQLMNACVRSDKYEVERLIREGLTPQQAINQKNSRAKTALMIACENAGSDFNQLENQNRLQIVKLLLDAGADPSLKDENGQNSLMLLFNKFSPFAKVYHNAEEAINKKEIDGEIINYITMSDGSAIYFEGDEEYEIHMNQHKKQIKDFNAGVQDAKIETKFSISQYFKVNEDAVIAYKETLKNQLLESSIEMAGTIVPQLLAAGVNIHEVDNNRETAMMIAQKKQSSQYCDILLRNGARRSDIEVRDNNFWSGEEEEAMLHKIFRYNLSCPFLSEDDMDIVKRSAIFAAESKKMKELLLKTELINPQKNLFENRQDLECYIKFAKADFFLGLACSEDKFVPASATNSNRVQNSVHAPVVLGRIIGSNILRDEFKEQFLICDVARKITSGMKINIAYGGNVRILPASWQGHSAYFMIESDAKDNPVKLSYCNAPAPNSSQVWGFGETVFALSKEKMNNQGKNSLDKLENYLSELTNLSATRDAENDVIRSIKTDIVDLEKENAVQFKIPTKPQKRGNCELKSFNILLRAVLSKMYPELVFEIDEKPGGSGYKIYKYFKKTLIDVNLDDLREVIKESEGKTWCESAKNRLQQVTERLERKNPVTSPEVSFAVLAKAKEDHRSIVS